MSAARTLGRYGAEVHVLPERSQWEPLKRSRYVRNARAWSFFEGADDMDKRWLQYLRESAEVLSGSVLLPCCDDGLEFLALRRGTLADLGYRPVKANYEAVMDMLDKARTYEIARKAGVAAPDTVLISSLEHLRAAAGDFRYPCALKPVHSHRFQRHFPVKGFVVTSPAELESRYRSVEEAGLAVLLTEIVKGTDDSYCSYFSYIDEDGQPLVHFTKRKLRQYPNGFGAGTYHVTAWEPEAAELGQRFARFAGLRGLVNVEFKRDANDGKLKLIESNPRLVASNELVRRAGVDFARITYDRAIGRPAAPADGFQEGLYMWQPVGDYRAFREYRSNGQLTTLQWLASLVHRQMLPIVALDDLAPVTGWLTHNFRK